MILAILETPKCILWLTQLSQHRGDWGKMIHCGKMIQREFSIEDAMHDVNASFEIRHFIRKAQPKQSKVKLNL